MGRAAAASRIEFHVDAAAEDNKRSQPNKPVTAAALEAFIYGRASLAPETLKALAVHLFDGRDEYDPAIDMLRPAKREEPRPLGIRPPPITETMTLPVYQAGPPPPSPGMVPPAMPIRRARAGPSRCACRFR